jgi:hypothetical protein
MPWSWLNTIYKPPKRIEPLALWLGSLRIDQTRRWGVTRRRPLAFGPRIRAICHLFKSAPLNHNGHLDSQRLSQTRPDAPTRSTWRCSTRCPIEYNKVLESNFDDLTRPAAATRRAPVSGQRTAQHQVRTLLTSPYVRLHLMHPLCVWSPASDRLQKVT